MNKITFQLARCGCTLRVTSQTSYSPEYITPTHTNTVPVLMIAGAAPIKRQFLLQNVSKLGENLCIGGVIGYIAYST
jgi:hypothetical protein